MTDTTDTNGADVRDGVPAINVDALHARLERRGPPAGDSANDSTGGAASDRAIEHTRVQVIDVREDWEWAQGHIAGAAHIPLGELPRRLGEIDANRDAVFICHLGGRSEAATRFARQQGLTRASNVTGGMDAWESRRYPVE